MLWFWWDFFLLARALLWLLLVQSSIPSYDEAMEDFEQGKIRQCKVRRKSQGAFFWGLGRVNPRVEAHDKKDQISKKNLVLDGILHDFSGVNCPCPFVKCMDSTEIFWKTHRRLFFECLSLLGKQQRRKTLPQSSVNPNEFMKIGHPKRIQQETFVPNIHCQVQNCS